MILIPILASVLSVGSFVILPQEKIPEKPILFEDDIPKALTNSVDVIGALVSRETPPRHLLQTFKKLDVKCYVRVKYHPEVKSEYVRRVCGFLSYASGADGVCLMDYKNFPPDWREAVKAAREDVKAAEKLRSLQTRRVAWWFTYADFIHTDCDQLRSLCRRYFAAGDVPKSNSVFPRDEVSEFCDLPTQEVVKEVETKDDFCRVRIELKRKDGSPVPYELVVDTMPITSGPQAPRTAGLNFRFGYRFRPYMAGGWLESNRENRVSFDPQFETFSPSYPKPKFAVAIRRLPNGVKKLRVKAFVVEKPRQKEGS